LICRIGAKEVRKANRKSIFPKCCLRRRSRAQNVHVVLATNSTQLALDRKEEEADDRIKMHRKSEPLIEGDKKGENYPDSTNLFENILDKFMK
jgi:hypothetical protein